MVWYVVIAIIVGVTFATAMVPKIIDDFTYGKVEFGDFLFACVIGILFGAVVGFLWPVTVTLGAVFYGLWRLYLVSQESTKRKKSNINSYGCSHPTDKTEKRTGLKALFKW